ncbi:MAG: hypothetical protein R3D83_10805 [Caenibius sp.]
MPASLKASIPADGDVAPIHAIRDLAEKYNALTYIDEAGRRACMAHAAAALERDEAAHRIDIIEGTLGKVFDRWAAEQWPMRGSWTLSAAMPRFHLHHH